MMTRAPPADTIDTPNDLPYDSAVAVPKKRHIHWGWGMIRVRDVVTKRGQSRRAVLDLTAS